MHGSLSFPNFGSFAIGCDGLLSFKLQACVNLGISGPPGATSFLM